MCGRLEPTQLGTEADAARWVLVSEDKRGLAGEKSLFYAVLWCVAVSMCGVGERGQTSLAGEKTYSAAMRCCVLRGRHTDKQTTITHIRTYIHS